MAKINQSYEIETEESVKLFDEYLRNNDFPFIVTPSSNDGANFNICFYSESERDECDMWIEENLF